MSYETMPWIPYGIISVVLITVLVGIAAELIARWNLNATIRLRKRLARRARKQRHESFISNMELMRQRDMDRASRALTQSKFQRDWKGTR